MSLLRFIFGVGILVVLILIVREYRASRKIWETEHAMEDTKLMASLFQGFRLQIGILNLKHLSRLLRSVRQLWRLLPQRQMLTRRIRML